MQGFDNPHGHEVAADETGHRHPAHAEEPPESFGRTQLLGLAALLAFPVVIYLVFRLF